MIFCGAAILAPNIFEAGQAESRRLLWSMTRLRSTKYDALYTKTGLSLPSFCD